MHLAKRRRQEGLQNLLRTAASNTVGLPWIEALRVHALRKCDNSFVQLLREHAGIAFVGVEVVNDLHAAGIGESDLVGNLRRRVGNLRRGSWITGHQRDPCIIPAN